MQLSRRKFLAHTAGYTALFTMIPDQSKAMVRVRENNLDILLENLRNEIANNSPNASYSQNLTDMLIPITIATWNRMLIPHLIPTEADRGYRDKHNILTLRVRNKHIMALNRRLSSQFSFECAYDGCPACGNGSRFAHDNETCHEATTKWLHQIYVDRAKDIAAELDFDLLCDMYGYGSHCDQTLPSNLNDFIRTIIAIARHMNPSGSWVIISPELAQRHLNVVNPDVGNKPVAYLDHMPVYINPHSGRFPGVLIGHDGSQESALLWSPHLLVRTGSAVICPYTFEPYLPFWKRHGTWIDPKRIANHFVTASS